MSSSLTSMLADPGRLAAVRQTNLLDTPAEAVFDRLARLVARVLGTPIAVMSLIDQHRQFFKASLGMPEPWATLRQAPVSHSMCRYVLATGQPLVIGDVRWDALGSDNPFMAELGAVAYMGIPLVLSSGHVVGSFCVADRRPRDWTGEDLAGLKDLAGLVMDEIELRSELQAHKVADDALTQHNQHLWGALEAVPDAVVISTTNLDPKGPRIVHANRAFCELTGHPVEELVGSSLRLVQCPEAAASVYESIAAWLESGSPWVKETVSHRKDGTEYVARWQVAPLPDRSGQTTHWACTQQDVASHRKLEQRLADVEAGFQALLERVPAVVYTISPDPPYAPTYVSPQIEALLGEQASECIGTPGLWDRWVHPDDREWVNAECERTNETGEPFLGEYRILTRDGQERWVRDEAILVRDAAGRQLFWQGILTDITATRQASSRLAEALGREQDAAEQLAAALERERAGASTSARSPAAAWRRPPWPTSTRWWWTRRPCTSRWTAPRWNGSSRTSSSTRPGTPRRAPPSGCGSTPTARVPCWSWRTRGRACRRSSASRSSSPSVRAVTSPRTPPARGSAWRWSPSSPTCTVGAPGSRTAPAAAPRSGCSFPTGPPRRPPPPSCRDRGRGPRPGRRTGDGGRRPRPAAGRSGAARPPGRQAAAGGTRTPTRRPTRGRRSRWRRRRPGCWPPVGGRRRRAPGRCHPPSSALRAAGGRGRGTSGRDRRRGRRPRPGRG